MSVQEVDKIVFCAILNDFLLPQLPLDLGKWELVKPTSEEFEATRSTIRKYASVSIDSKPIQEMEKATEGQLSKIKGTTMVLSNNPEKFRYTILKPKFEAERQDIDKLSEACRISDCNLWTEIWVSELTYPQPRHNFIQMSAFYSSTSHFHYPLNLDFQHLKEVISLRSTFYDKKYPTITEAFKMFREQDSVDDRSHLKHLGYFAIIESLLSHNPSKNDSIDSISKQLQRNLILLHNRMPENYNLMLTQFQQGKPRTIISKLYSYRSEIAHGGQGQKELEYLFNNKPNHDEYKLKNINNSIYWIAWYLRKVTQRILVQAMREPQLVNDLK